METEVTTNKNTKLAVYLLSWLALGLGVVFLVSQRHSSQTINNLSKELQSKQLVQQLRTIEKPKLEMLKKQLLEQLSWVNLQLGKVDQVIIQTRQAECKAMGTECE